MVKFYTNLEAYENDENKNDEQITVVNRNKYIDIDCYMTAKTEYSAFKKLVTALKNAGYETLIKGLQQDMTYKEDFLNCLNIDTYHYPEEQRNGFYGYYIEEIDNNRYYLRHFTPIQ
jgi:hypothetical protein